MSSPARGPEDDRPFQHYSWKNRLISWISATFFDHVTYTVRHGPIKGMKRKGGLGWLPFAATATPETHFWESIGPELRDSVVYDVGAFHGLLTLFFSAHAREVLSYEPNNANFKRLRENVALNNISNVHLRNVGLGAAAQEATMFFAPLTPGGASVEPQSAERLAHAGGRSQKIRITTIDAEVLGGAPAPNFVKIDVEGFELKVLQGARQTLANYRPALFLEMHGETMPEKRRKTSEIVDYLAAAGYESLRHVETGAEITAANAETACQGHLYCVYRAGEPVQAKAAAIS